MVNEFWDWMDSTLVEAKSALTMAKDDMVQYYNWHWIPVLEYQVGDKVYLDASGICTTPLTETFPLLPWPLHDSGESWMEYVPASPSNIHVLPPPHF